MRRLKLCVWLAFVLLQASPTPARPDVIFKVPEVLVRHAAGARPVGTGPAGTGPAGTGPAGAAAAAGSNSSNAEESQPPPRYTEHEVSVEDARKAARIMEPFQVAASLPGCGLCSRWELEYCAGGALGDHCCCERRYMREPFPWLPHVCFLPTERCAPRALNCARYTRIRDCCCNRMLAEKWKGILSKASHVSSSGVWLLVLSLLLCSLRL